LQDAVEARKAAVRHTLDGKRERRHDPSHHRAQFEKKMVLLNIYVTRDGKYEQFLVMNQL
jgi:hypothetical protein